MLEEAPKLSEKEIMQKFLHAALFFSLSFVFFLRLLFSKKKLQIPREAGDLGCSVRGRHSTEKGEPPWPFYLLDFC